MRQLSIFERLASGETVSGKPIYLYETNAENALRGRALVLSNRVVTVFERDGISNQAITAGLEVLQREYRDDRHYGDNKPSRWFDIQGKRIPVTPEPKFNYWEFFGYAQSGSFDSYAEFAKDFGFDDKITYDIANGLVALLLIDDAICLLEDGRSFEAAASIFDAFEAVEEMILPKREKLIASEALKAQSQGGAEARYRYDKDGKQAAKKLVHDCWLDWEQGKSKVQYKTQSQFARDMIDKVDINANGEPVISFDTILKKWIPIWQGEKK